MTTEIPPAALAELERQEAAMTPASWLVFEAYDGARTIASMRSCDRHVSIGTAEQGEPYPWTMTDANAVGLVAMRNAYRELLATVAAARAREAWFRLLWEVQHFSTGSRAWYLSRADCDGGSEWQLRERKFKRGGRRIEPPEETLLYTMGADGYQQGPQYTPEHVVVLAALLSDARELANTPRRAEGD